MTIGSAFDGSFSFSGPYATPVDPTRPQATEPASLDENDDAVDDIDKIFGAPPGPADAAAAGPFPSQPIATASVTETQPGLVDQKPENHPVFVVEHAGADPSPLDLRAGRAARMFWLWFATNSSVVSIAIGAVIRRYPDLRFVGKRPEWKANYTLRALNVLPVVLDGRK